MESPWPLLPCRSSPAKTNLESGKKMLLWKWIEIICGEVVVMER